MNEQNLTDPITLDNEQQELAKQVINSFKESQLIWFSGYLSGYVNAININGINQDISSIIKETGIPVRDNAIGNQQETKQLTILYGTRTGNSKKIAELLGENISKAGIKANLADMGEYNPKNLKNETYLTVIVSTHGEGEPPLAAEEFYEFLNSKRATRLENLQYSVLALGDKSYAQFCQTGADIDKRLEELGAKRVADRMDCDVEFMTTAEEWINNVTKSFAQNGQQSTLSKEVKSDGGTAAESVVDRNKPFKAEVLEKIKLNGRGSDKETYHLEISTAGSGLKFLPGDSLGIYPVNDNELVKKILKEIKLTGQDKVDIHGNEISLEEALKNKLEIRILSRDVIEKHQKYVDNNDLASMLKDNMALSDFLFESDLLDLLKKYPYPYSAKELVSILRKIQPRLYSIASSLEANPDEVHITVGTLRYRTDGRDKKGACSSFLADTVNIGETIDVFIEHNEAFRLPAEDNAPVIMIGPGTGVAPFRAFMQQRVESGAVGKNWLFFGDRHFTTDFLYQSEWLNYKKKGVLTNLSVAFSRDTPEKIYVQHKLLEKSKEIMEWIENGAYIYVCGDMKQMSKDVLKTFIEIVAKEKQLEQEEAKTFVQTLRRSKHYQEDVY